METVPSPEIAEIPDGFGGFFADRSGTMVVLSGCDRPEPCSGSMNELMTDYLGRTYRKFIDAGRMLYLDDKQVFQHDPLYCSGPTRFDSKEKLDPKADLYHKAVLELPVPGRDGETAPITVSFSLLPREWMISFGGADNAEAEARRIGQNEGLSILRADREIFYGKFPDLIGLKKGEFSYEEIDRWWGCEISFPPELDDYFQVRCVKTGVDPIGPLRDRLKKLLADTILPLRQVIKMELPQMNTYENRDKVLSGNADRLLSSLGAESKPMYTVVPVRYPQNILYETEDLPGGKTAIKLNVNHPFYEKVVRPLCGDIPDGDDAESLNEKGKSMDMIMLLLLSHAKAAASSTGKEQDLYNDLLSRWGEILNSAMR